MFDFLTRLVQRRRLVPVSKALRVEPGIIEGQVQSAIAAIDHVHTDGALPFLPVKADWIPDSHGTYQQGVSGNAVEIVISLVTSHIEITTVHEIGHFLDHKGLDQTAAWASVNSASLARWREAVKQSGAVQALRHFSDPAVRTMEVTLWDGSVVEYPIDKAYVIYLLKAEELWARSYAQFIAVTSREATLLRQLEQERNRPVSGLYYPKHWEDADFQPIQTEIETLFRGLRWRQ